MLWSRRRSRSSASQNSVSTTACNGPLLNVPGSNNSLGAQSGSRLPLAPLNPQSSSSSAVASNTEEISASSTLNCAHDMSRSNIGKQILGNRALFDEDEITGKAKRKGNVTQTQGLSPLSPSRTSPRRMAAAVSSSQSGSRRSSLPAIPSTSGVPPVCVSPQATNSKKVTADPSCSTNDDLYQGLSTFTFGAARPSLSPSPSPSYDADVEADEMISPLTAVRRASADRTPRPSLSAQGHSSHPVQFSGQPRDPPSPPLAARRSSRDQNYSDGFDTSPSTRQPLSRSAAIPVAGKNVPPFLIPEAAAVSNYHHASPSDRDRIRQRASDGSHYTFGERDFTFSSGPMQRTASGSPTSSRASSRLEFSSDEDFDYRFISPVPFARDTEDTSLDEESAPASNVYPRRGSLPIAIPGSIASSHGGIAMAEIVGDARRERDGSMATLRRPSRSLDDDLRVSNAGFGLGPASSGSGPVPKSEPQSRGDWASLEAHVQAQQQQERQQQSDEATVINNVYQELGLNLEYVLGAGDATDRRSSDTLSYVQAQQRRPSQANGMWGWNTAGRRPSTGTVGTGVDDTFARHVRKWGGLGDWSFKREKADGNGLLNPWGIEPQVSSRGSVSDTPRDEKAKTRGKERTVRRPEMGMLPGSQEIWRCEFVGRFKVDRQTVQPDPTKMPHQRLNLRHIIDPYSRGNTRGGPNITIHKHSRAFAFSIYRGHNLSNRHRTWPGILLAPKRVQEQYTSTRTTSKLVTHGLLEDQDRGGERSRASTVGRRDKEFEKERKKRQATEVAKVKKEAKKDKGSYSQTSSFGSISSTHSTPPSTGSTSAGPPLVHTYPPAPSAIIRKEKSHDVLPPSSPTSTGPSSCCSTSRPQTSVSDQSTVRELYSHNRSKLPGSRRDSFDLDDGPPQRTPHAETYATLDSSLIEYVRANADNRSAEPDPNPSFFKRFLRPGPRAAVQPPNYPAGPTSASLEGQYKAPWLTMVGRAKQEETDRVIHNLNTSFMGVGLLPANSSKPPRIRGTRPKKVENVNILEHVPDDSLYMLLPLWPGETDPVSTRYEGTNPSNNVLLEDRQYLLVYYVAFHRPLEKERSASSKETASVSDERSILLSEFRAVARVVGYNELRRTGVRLPSDGLSMTGPIWEAMQHIPSLNHAERQSFVIATYLGREHGVEIVPEGLVKMGLCLPIPEHQKDSDAGDWEEEAILSPIGRAAIEMAWAGCMALASFGLT